MSSLLDLDALRVFVVAQDLGGYNRAALALHRSQSAVSQQLRKLEDQTGQALVHRHGRRLVLTPAGETLLAYARRLLSLNEETMAALHGYTIAGHVRFGVVGDFAESWLPELLATFRRAHPKALLEVSVDRASALFESLDNGALDLVLAFGGDGRSDASPLLSLPQRWLGQAGYRFEKGEPVELIVLPAPCRFRQQAIHRLEAAGIPWRLSFTGRSVATLWAAVRSGLGITYRLVDALPRGISILDEPQGAGVETDIAVNLHDGGRQGNLLVEHLKEQIMELGATRGSVGGNGAKEKAISCAF